ncbi:hypothetical protein M2280_006313, partial [Prescottella agglutinans]|nr:hypothetical protein [Prescottella agglutinans]
MKSPDSPGRFNYDDCTLDDYALEHVSCGELLEAGECGGEVEESGEVFAVAFVA